MEVDPRVGGLLRYLANAGLLDVLKQNPFVYTMVFRGMFLRGEFLEKDGDYGFKLKDTVYTTSGPVPYTDAWEKLTKDRILAVMDLLPPSPVYNGLRFEEEGRNRSYGRAAREYGVYLDDNRVFVATVYPKTEYMDFCYPIPAGFNGVDLRIIDTTLKTIDVIKAITYRFCMCNDAVRGLVFKVRPNSEPAKKLAKYCPLLKENTYSYFSADMSPVKASANYKPATEPAHITFYPERDLAIFEPKTPEEVAQGFHSLIQQEWPVHIVRVKAYDNRLPAWLKQYPVVTRGIRTVDCRFAALMGGLNA